MFPSSYPSGMGDIILDYMKFFCFTSSRPHPGPSRHSRLLNANSSMSRKAEERSENQINRVYYVIVFHPRTFVQKVTFRGNEKKNFFSSFFSFGFQIE